MCFFYFLCVSTRTSILTSCYTFKPKLELEIRNFPVTTVTKKKTYKILWIPLMRKMQDFYVENYKTLKTLYMNGLQNLAMLSDNKI